LFFFFGKNKPFGKIWQRTKQEKSEKDFDLFKEYFMYEMPNNISKAYQKKIVQKTAPKRQADYCQVGTFPLRFL
jgi:hypothetical protein